MKNIGIIFYKYLKRLKYPGLEHNSQKGSTLAITLMAVAAMSISFYFFADYVIVLKREVIKSEAIVNYKLGLNSVLDFLIYATEQKTCLTETLEFDNPSSCTWEHPRNIGRVIMGSDTRSFIELHQTTNIPSDLELESFEAVVPIVNITSTHPLYQILKSIIDKPIVETVGKSTESFKITSVYYKFSRPNKTNDNNLPQSGKERFLRINIEFRDKNNKVISIANNSISAETLIGIYPRELGSFALIIPKDLHLDSQIASANGDIKLIDPSTQAFSENWSGLNFKSPVYVQNDIYLPNIKEGEKKIVPVEFSNKVIMGRGSLKLEKSDFEPLPGANRTWSNFNGIKGFKKGVVSDGAEDPGLIVFRAGQVSQNDPTLMDKCAILNNINNEKSSDNALSNLAKHNMFQSYFGGTSSQYFIGTKTSTVDLISNSFGYNLFLTGGKVFNRQDIDKLNPKSILQVTIKLDGNTYVRNMSSKENQTVNVPARSLCGGKSASIELETSTPPASSKSVTREVNFNVALGSKNQYIYSSTLVTYITPLPSPIPIVSAVPVASLSPLASAVPEASLSPLASAVPVASSSPLASAVPEASSSPLASAVPEATPIPIETVTTATCSLPEVSVMAFDSSFSEGKLISTISNGAEVINSLTLPIEFTMQNGNIVAPEQLKASSLNLTGDIASLKMQSFDEDKCVDANTIYYTNMSTSFTSTTRRSWNFANLGGSIYKDPILNEVVFDGTNSTETNAIFQVRSIVGTCRIKESATFVSGFFTCDQLIIEQRTKPLLIIASVIANKITIDSSAFKYGINWQTIYHPDSLAILMETKILKPLGPVDINKKCQDISTPVWHPNPDFKEEVDKFLCSPLFLRSTAQPFQWTAVDPDCGLLADNSSTVCKNEIRHFYISEISRRSGL